MKLKFRTEIPIPHSSWELSWGQNVQLYGSCFVEEIGKLLEKNRFQVDCNPFGVLYNPLSIAQSVLKLMKGEDLTHFIEERDGQFHSLLHHSSFSSANREQLINNIHSRAKTSGLFLTKSDVLIFTFGTAYTYWYKGNVVANCHKLPENYFQRRRLQVEEIVLVWRELLENLKEHNPNIHIIFSISPIRHWRDGIHNNQLSKSILLLSVEGLCQEFDFCSYFPSYEIVMDELRDYRFYDVDLNHLSPFAISYIWERFLETYCSKSQIEMIDEWGKILQLMEHRPLISTKGNEWNEFLAEKQNLFQEKIQRIKK